MVWFEHGATRIYYEEEGSGDPILVIPGWSLSIEDMAPIRQALVGGYRVIAADAPGSGRSEPQPRKFTASYLEDDARSFLALLDKLGAAPAHIVGFSDGGEYALLVAELNPSTVRSIVAWGAAGQLAASTGIAEMFARVVDDPIPPMKEFSGYLKTTYGEEKRPDNDHQRRQGVAGDYRCGRGHKPKARSRDHVSRSSHHRREGLS